MEEIAIEQVNTQFRDLWNGTVRDYKEGVITYDDICAYQDSIFMDWEFELTQAARIIAANLIPWDQLRC